jgi:hypothetical protein
MLAAMVVNWQVPSQAGLFDRFRKQKTPPGSPGGVFSL